jgi:hypothetical protein
VPDVERHVAEAVDIEDVGDDPVRVDARLRQLDSGQGRRLDLLADLGQAGAERR